MEYMCIPRNKYLAIYFLYAWVPAIHPREAKMGLGKAKEETYIENNGPSGFLNTDKFKHGSSEMIRTCDRT